MNIPIHPPLSIGYLGAVLRQAGHDVRAIDAAAENLSIPVLVKRIQSLNPDVIGITTNISSSRKAIMTARLIRINVGSIPIILGGPWATIEYRRILKERVADIVVCGEGERTIVELMENLNYTHRLAEVKGIAFLDSNGSIVKTQDREHIVDLDSLPFPAWDLLPSSKRYNFPHRKEPFYPIMTTRGCPFDCIHCTKVIHGYKIRKRSVDNVIQEIRYLKEKFGIKELMIIDDSFNFDLDYAEKILDEIIRNKFDLVLKFSNGVRADKITNRLVRKMKVAGTYFVSIGIESGNQKIVNKIGKKLDLNKVVTATQVLKKNKIITSGFFMLGLPYDTFGTMMETLNFAKSLDLDYPHFFKAIPFPGTRMYDIIKEHGRFIKNAKDAAVESYNTNVANFEIWALKNQDIEEAYNISYRWFYFRPRKVLNLIGEFRSIYNIWWTIKEFLAVIFVNLFHLI